MDELDESVSLESTIKSILAISSDINNADEVPDSNTAADETACVELQPEELASSHNISEPSMLENELRKSFVQVDLLKEYRDLEERRELVDNRNENTGDEIVDNVGYHITTDENQISESVLLEELPPQEVEGEMEALDVAENIREDYDNVLDECDDVKESIILTDEQNVPLQVDCPLSSSSRLSLERNEELDSPERIPEEVEETINSSTDNRNQTGI